MSKNSAKPRLSFTALSKRFLKINILRPLSKLIPQTLTSRLVLYITLVAFLILFGMLVLVYNQHWRKIRYHLISGIASNIYYSSVLKNEPNFNKNLMAFAEDSSQFRIEAIPPKWSSLAPMKHAVSKLTKQAKILQDVLSRNLPFPFQIQNNSQGKVRVIVVISDQQWLQFTISSSAFFTYSLRSIVADTILLYLILIVLSYFFFKINTAPLKALAKSVKRFGQGEADTPLKPRGTIELRSTITAFNRMKSSINRHIEQRTLMLSSISHDLKSSLTRLHLLLDLYSSNSGYRELRDELTNMDHMVSNYLAFAKDEFSDEALQKVNIKQYMNELVDQYKLLPNKKLILLLDHQKRNIDLRPVTVRRILTNLIDNGLKYGNSVQITVKDKHHHVKIIIEDDGPGIPASKYANVFKPFYRLEKARTLAVNTANAGLGLSIVKDAVHKHGGSIHLGKSKMSGLKVSVILPY